MSKRKLLLADDSETVQKVVNLTFELEGIEVITFGDGDSAMQQMAAVAPDVVLADVNMPGVSGYEICQKIKENEATKNTPVILLVGSFEPFDEERAMQVGADDYLTKPFQSIRQLVSKVNELLAPQSARAATETSFEETLEMEQNRYSESGLGDPGMDDEMIQTASVGNTVYDEAAKYQNQADKENEPEDYTTTQPLNENDWQEIYPAGQNAAETEQTVYELADDRGEVVEVEEAGAAAENETFAEPETDRQDSETQDFDPSGEQFSESQDDEFGYQPDDIDHYYQEPDFKEETEQFSETADEVAVDAAPSEDQPGLEQSEAPVADEAGFDESEPETVDAADHTAIEHAVQVEPDPQTTAAEEPFADSEIVADQPEISQPAAPVLNFDEFDLLEIPYPEQLSRSETVTAAEPQIEIEEVSREENTEQLKDEVTKYTTGVSLSPEDIEAIADRVVEKLSARLKE